MEIYDVIIVGAGIAGCGLAYNLKRMGYDGNILIIDKEEVGANAAYGYRNTCEKIAKEYNLPYEHVYKGIKIGTEDKTHFILNRKFYFIDYKKACRMLLKNSNFEYKKEKAVRINKSILETDKNQYFFKILVDCSGSDFFGKRQLKQKLPFRYWVGKTTVLKNILKDKDYFYYQINDSGFIEDLYPLKNKTLQGKWMYSEKNDLNSIIPEKNTIFGEKINNPILKKDYCVIYPATPVLPLVHKNIAFLGDSFGNPVTTSGCGIKVILDSSKILAKSIKKDDLKSYEKIWRKKYLDIFIRYLSLKYYTFHKLKFFKNLKKTVSWKELAFQFEKYPELFNIMFDGEENFKLPTGMKKAFSKSSKIFMIMYFSYLKLKYFLMS